MYLDVDKQDPDAIHREWQMSRKMSYERDREMFTSIDSAMETFHARYDNRMRKKLIKSLHTEYMEGEGYFFNELMRDCGVNNWCAWWSGKSLMKRLSMDLQTVLHIDGDVMYKFEYHSYRNQRPKYQVIYRGRDYGDGDPLPYDKFCEVRDMNSCSHISERKNIRGSFFIDGVQYCCTGSVSGGNDLEQAWANEMVPIDEWTGRPPKKYPGYPEVTYEGTIIKYKGHEFVLKGERVKFIETKEGQQIQLF